MIIKGDLSQLEWRTYLEWSGETTGIEEIIRGVDVHSTNQAEFNLPERLVAKVFLFRWIYRGSAFAYANDADFMPTSSKPNFWQKVIDKANEKYHILYDFQNKLVEQVEQGGTIVTPTGREYEFEMKQGKEGDLYWPIRDIVNHPNQGLAADLVMIARISLKRRIDALGFGDRVKLFNTVHDDIELDVDNDPKMLYTICTTMEKVFRDLPSNFTKLYKKQWITPLAGEVSFGPSLGQLTDFNPKLGAEQFNAY